MKYVNETVRRQDRLLNEERALQLIRDSEYGVLSMVDADGGAYGLPLNYVGTANTACIYIALLKERNSGPWRTIRMRRSA